MDKNVDSPLVTVLMPVYNGEKYLREAIDSILHQTYTHFEFLIINDGSTDTSEEIILSYSDSRIRYIKNESNLRLIATLNKGIDLAKGEYIARMDADDISLPHRLERQVEFMENNPEIGILSTWIKMFGEYEKDIKYPLVHDELAVCFLFFCPISHPASIWRMSVIKKHKLLFDPSYPNAEDYKFFSIAVTKTKLANLPEILLLYRLHNNQVGVLSPDNLQKTTQKVQLDLITALVPDITYQEQKAWEEQINNYSDFKDPLNIISILNKIFDANCSANVYKQDILKRKLLRIWKNAILETTKIPLKMYFSLLKQPLYKSQNWTFKQRIYIFLKIFK